MYMHCVLKLSVIIHLELKSVVLKLEQEGEGNVFFESLFDTFINSCFIYDIFHKSPPSRSNL
jgi:hypothetical protein